MALDIPRKQLKKLRKRGRTSCVSPNPELKALNEVYDFLARRTDSNFNSAVSHRLKLSKRNRAPITLGRLGELMKNHPQKIACIVGTVTNDTLLEECPKLSVCALRFTEAARDRILKAGGEVLTFDQLPARAPTGKACILLRGHTKSRKAEKHFGRAPGLPRSHSRPYACPKISH